MALPASNIGPNVAIGNAVDRRYPTGGFNSARFTYTVVPTTSTASSVADFAVVSGGAWTLALGPNAAGTIVINGATYIDLGFARVVSATGSGASSAATNITVSGREEMVLADGTLSVGQPMVETFSGPTGTATTVSLKAFRYIGLVSTDGNTVSAIGIGHGDTLGFPYYVPAFAYVDLHYNAAVVTATTGFTAGVTTSPSTAIIGDVRGTYALQAAANGSRRFRASIWLFDPNTVTSLHGVTQNTTAGP